MCPKHSISTDFRPDNIPAELKALDTWVLWHPELRAADDKPTKIPDRVCDPRRRAKANDSTTWGPYKLAAAAALKSEAHGLGFVLTEDAGLTGLDLDNCRDPETGEIAAWALDILGLVNSYSEISPTGTGAKIFASGRKPAGRSRRSNVEMYECGRFYYGHRDAHPRDADDHRRVH